MNLEEMVPERFRVVYIKDTNSFKILDTWHATIKNLNLEDNPVLPDDSPAVKTLSSEEVNSLVGELIKIGWLDRMIASKTQVETPQPVRSEKSSKELIVEKIAEIALDNAANSDSRITVSKDAISALKEIASNL
jgi:hypothetical protein